MFLHLTIVDPRERILVGFADLGLSLVAALTRPFRRKPRSGDPSHILLLRLERIGDLLMSMDAIAAVREAVPDADIDLVVGSWNADLAAMLPGPTRVETLDAPWLARGEAGASTSAILRRAMVWRRRRYDLVINFEGDIRSNVIVGMTAAARRVGFGMAGGGPMLTEVVDHDAGRHISENSRRLVSRALKRRENDAAAATQHARLRIPCPARARAAALLDGHTRPLVGIHASGGRPIKQWNPERFAAVAARLQTSLGATIVLTGSPADRECVDTVKAALEPTRVVDVCGSADLPTLAAVLERLDVLVTGDTGPMHVAAAVHTPIVAVFGPSDPIRYAPPAAIARVVRIDLPCSPCNRIRRPPDRCVGHVPDCLSGITVEQVVDATRAVLTARVRDSRVEDEGPASPGRS